MAQRVYNAGAWDKVLGSLTITTAGVSVTTSFVGGSTQTAPNTSDYVTGCLIFFNSVPTSGDIEIEVRESGVSKVSGIMSNADIQLGFNWVKFSTPYQFTTTSANAYEPRFRNTLASSGSLARESSTTKTLLMMTYSSADAFGATDDIFLCGAHDTGLTSQTLTLTGTSNSWGSGTDRNYSSTVSRTLGAATVVGNGGTLEFDTTADCKLKQYGALLTTRGGLFDMRPGASSVSTLEFDNQVADGDFGLVTGSGAYGGQILTTGATVTNIISKYASGVGTAADPLVTQSAHSYSVDDEIIIPGLTYSTNQLKYIKSIPSSTQLVLADTIGGAESAITNTPAVGSHIAMLTRNSIIKNTTTTKGFWIFNNTTNSDYGCDFSYTRMEYPNCLSGKNLALSSTGHAVNIDGLVMYNNSAAGRISISWSGAVEQTSTDIVLMNTRGSNFSAQSGFSFAGATNKTVEGLYHYAEPGSTNCCGGLSINNTSTACTVREAHSYGGNAGNSTLGYAFGVYGSGNVIEDSSINSARRQALLLDACTTNTFTNCDFGTIGANTLDIYCGSSTLIKALFEDCNFASPILIDNYLNLLPGSDIGFQNMDGDETKHRWYTNNASFWSAGSGLTDTTVRTAGSLSLAIKPESATVGTNAFIIKTPAPPTSRVGMYGYIYRNATFSTGDIVVDFFLPGTLETDTPDDSYTMPTTTGEWLLFSVGAYNPSTVARYAKVRITAKTATAGAYCFLDDLYDAGTNNKVAGLDLWDAGHISPIMVVTDFSSAVPVLANAVWTDDVDYNPGTKGANSDAVLSNTDATQAKVDLL